MKLELKNVKINEAFSEETLMFMADLFVDGKKVAYAKNDGHGGCTYYNAYEGQHEVLKRAEEYALTLPSTFHEFGGETHEFKSNLENWIDNTVNKIADEKNKAKFLKKMQKDMETKIVFGVPDSGSYRMLGFKSKAKLTELSQGSINSLVLAVKAQMKPNEVIFNKNITI